MKVTKYSAKALDKDYNVIGFYYQQMEFTPSPIKEWNGRKPEILHFLITEVSGDWGLPGQPILQRIDPSTLKVFEEVEIE